MKNLFLRRLHLSLILALLLSATAVFSGEVILKPGENDIQVIENSSQRLRIHYDFSNFSADEVKTPEGIFTRLNVSQYAKRGVYGEPEMPVNSQLIEVPAFASLRIKILNSAIKEYDLTELGIRYPVYPMQPPVEKGTGQVEFLHRSAAYQADAFLGPDPVVVEYLGMMRGVNIARLEVSPIQYNPLKNSIRVYESIEFEVEFVHGDEGLTQHLKRTYYNPYFEGAFSGILNYREVANAGRDTLSRYPVKYVIVSDPMFEDQLQPFVEWKTRKGFQVIEAYTDDPQVGTTTFQIKAYLQAMYDNATPEDPAPTFVLFVGDIAQVPAWTGQAAGHVTDLYYVEYTNDYFPEMYYGRFSAQNTAQLQPQIDKTLLYEQYAMDDPSYLEEVVMIAGVDGNFAPTHGNGQINYGTINYFNEAHNILSHTYLYPESGSSSAAIRQNISDGVIFANYTAHGSPSGWADPSFTTSHIPALQNVGKYGLLVGNCCSTSEYQVGECFGEALLRAEDKGALGYIGASNSTYWDEDYYFGVGVGTISGNPPSYEETTLGYYDCAFHENGEPFTDWYTTMDQMIYSGNLAVTLGSPGMARYYWEAYCLMGDPSLMIYLGVPAEMTVTHDPLIPLGSPAFTVNAVPYAYVALSMDGELLGAALADSLGEVVIPLEGVTVPGMADIVATAQNYQPFEGTVLIANPEGPYVLLNDIILDDSLSGNNNSAADPGEEILFDAELKNWGSSEAQDVTATLVYHDSLWIDIFDDFHEFGMIPASDSVMQQGAYTIKVQDSIPDMTQVAFSLTIEDGGREVWSSNFSVMLHAPVLHVANLSVADTLEGNGNGRLDPGETADIYLMAGNTGHCDAYGALTTLSSTSEYLTINIDSCWMDTLAWGNMYPMHFNVTVSEDAQAGDYVNLSFLVNSTPYSSQKEFNLPVGLIIEDFETGDFTSFGWMTAGDQPWIIDDSETYEGMYAAMSGDIDDQEISILYLDMEVINDDSVSFFRKVSCEDDPSGTDYDWLAFYIDDEEVERWDGELDWTRVAYPVEEGTRTFKWVYSKDYSVSSGSDAAWIDYIIFPGMTQAVSVEELIEKYNASVSVYPNPASEEAIIHLYLAEEDEITVRLMDITRRKLQEPLSAQMLSGGDHTVAIDTGSLPAGAYIVLVESSRQRIIKKLIRK
jgi:hypothetical protein